MPWRLPAEFEPQDAVLVAWPHAGTDWVRNLADVEASYVSLCEAITAHQRVVIVAANEQIEAHASGLLAGAGVALSGVRFVLAEYDDTWLRDSGPVTVTDGTRFRLLDFRFTGWGGKFGGGRDDALTSSLHRSGLFGEHALDPRDFALEGGAIESDGTGTLLTTRICLAQRHPGRTGMELAQALLDEVPCERVILLDHGELEGDDTDGHIDTLARFIAVDAIAYQGCDDPEDPHFEPLARMAAELGDLRTREGLPYRLVRLPWAAPVRGADGRRLAASYANFLIINGAVLMPAYGDPADELAQAVMAAAMPDRRIRRVPCRPLIEQNGSLHCLTMQLPQGVLGER